MSFNIGEIVTISYKGELRCGRVERVTDKVVTMYDFKRAAYRSFSWKEIRPATAELTMKEV